MLLDVIIWVLAIIGGCTIVAWVLYLGFLIERSGFFDDRDER
jgi:hypothetical protein